MFPKLFSSSCEISSKCNAFVQNKDDGNEGVNSLSSSSPDVKVPEMWDELLVNTGECKKFPNLTVITGHPSQTHTVHHTTPSMDSVAEPDTMSSRPRKGGVEDTGVLNVVLSRNISDNTTSDKPDIPRTNDTDTDESFKVCDDYYSRWGMMRGRLLGGGESGVAAAGTQNWGQGGGGPQGGAGGWSGGQPHRQQNNNTQSQGAGPSSQQSQAQAGAQQPNQTSQTSANNQPNNQPGNASNSQQPANASGPNNNQTGTNSNNNQPNNQQNNNNPSNNTNQQPGTNQPNNNNNWNSKPGQPPQATSTKQQLEQLNSMREALFSQDGWGGQNVNQDSNWDIPGSPEPGAKESMSGAPQTMWKPNVNNGTDLWEANLRNGGIVAPPAAPVPKVPISHTPTSHIGGVWGEEDEGDFSNMWTGVPAAGSQTPGGGPPQWPSGPGGPPPPAVWTGKKEGEWGGPGGGAGGWGDQRHDMRPDVIRCDQRGISGRLNGEAMWPHPHHKVPGSGGGGPGGGGGWGAPAPPLKDMSGLGKPSGWEEPSPPAQRRTMPNYDDGTSLWSQQNRPAMPGQGKVSHWKDLPTGGQPMGRGGMQCPPGGRNPNMKPDPGGGPMWHPGAQGGGPRNGWESAGVDPCWADDKPAAAPWLDQTLPQAWQGAANKHKHPWEPEIEPNPASSWGMMHPGKQPASKTNKDFMWNNRTYRMLADMVYKKDEVENNALRNSSMGVEDALDPSPVWGARRGGHDGLDGPTEPHGGLFSGGPAQVCIPFQSAPTGPPPGPLQQAQASRQQQTTQQPSTQQLRMLVQQIQTAVHAGYLQQQILNQPLAPQTLLLLNQLLQQIKVLQNVQHLYQAQHAQQNPLKSASSQLLLQTQVKLTQTKQQIANLQNQIASQQAMYMSQQKQQAAQQMPPQHQQNDLFRNNIHDPLSALQSNFSDISLKDSQMVNPLSYPTGGTGQSRLNQWKLPAPDKETDVIGGGGGEFSRAPGSKGAGAGGGGGSPLLPEGAWSSREAPTSWPPSDTSSDPSSDPNKDWPTGASQQPPAFSDLVPEFKPGEPWKGNPMKTTDDDPTLTPSSIVRSPLVLPSINVKDSHILGAGPSVQGKSSPTSSDLITSIPSLSLSTSTWTFNPSTQPQTSNSSMLKNLGGGAGNKGSGAAGAGWGDTSGELWSGGGGKGRPPPGLGGAKPGVTPTSTNGWSAPRWSQSTSTGGQPSNWNASTWLLLRNLTPQIDGSTLKTLCIQHGPLINFHLFLNNGIALARYSSREEAQKAQGALNNCVLGNTTIFAENPSDSDVMPLVTHLQNQGGGGGGGGGGGAGGGGAGAGTGGGGAAGTPWRTPTPGGSAASQLWSSSTSSLWGADTPTTTNSSFLPADLGGESM